MATKAHAFELHDDPSQMEPLLPGECRQGPLLERAHDLRLLLRAMNSCYSNKIEGQHALPLEIAQVKRSARVAGTHKPAAGLRCGLEDQ